MSADHLHNLSVLSRAALRDLPAANLHTASEAIVWAETERDRLRAEAAKPMPVETIGPEKPPDAQ